MLIYLLLYIPFILTSYFDTKKVKIGYKKQILNFWVILLTLFWGLRWKCGTDWEQFHDTYYLSRFSNMFSFDRGMSEMLEPGYVFINALLNSLHLPYTVFLLLFSFILLFLLSRFCLNHIEYPIIGFVFIIISFGIFFPTRQLFAMSIMSCGYKYLTFLNKKNILKYVSLILIAASIHTSALFGLVFLFLTAFRVSCKWALIIYGTSFLFVKFTPIIIEFILSKIGFMGGLVMVRLTSYSQSVSSIGDDFSTRGLLSYLLPMIFMAFFILFRYNDKKGLFKQICFNGFLAQEVIRNFFSEIMRDLMRLQAFTLPFSAVLTAQLFGMFKNTGRLCFCALMIYYLLKMLLGYFSYLYIPYTSIFS